MYLNGFNFDVDDDISPKAPLPSRDSSYWFPKNRDGVSSAGWALLDIFMEIMKDKQTYLEIGTYDGLYVSLMAERYPDKDFFAIDPFADQGEGHFPYFAANCREFPNIYLYKISSLDILEWFRGKIEYDLIFIDGVHKYEYVSFELPICHDLLTPGGMIVCHDGAPGGEVRKAMDDWSERTGVHLKPFNYDVPSVGKNYLEVFYK